MAVGDLLRWKYTINKVPLVCVYILNILNVCVYIYECNTKNCFILSKSSVWGPALCESASLLQTECDEEHLSWLSLDWAQVRELLCLLLRVSRASGAQHCAAAAVLF